MKKYLTAFILALVLLTGSSLETKAQWVVHDPGHTYLNSFEWASNVKKWASQINEMVDAQKLRLGLQKIDQPKQLRSLKDLADLLLELVNLLQAETQLLGIYHLVDLTGPFLHI